MVTSTGPATGALNPREKALEDFRKKIMDHKEIEARLKQSEYSDKVHVVFLYSNVHCSERRV